MQPARFALQILRWHSRARIGFTGTPQDGTSWSGHANVALDLRRFTHDGAEDRRPDLSPSRRDGGKKPDSLFLIDAASRLQAPDRQRGRILGQVAEACGAET